MSSGVKKVGGTSCIIDCFSELSSRRTIGGEACGTEDCPSALSCGATIDDENGGTMACLSGWLSGTNLGCGNWPSELSSRASTGGDTIGIKDCICCESSLSFSTFIIIVKFLRLPLCV